MTDPAAAPIAGTTRHDIAPASGGEPYRVFVHAPTGPAPAQGWPVLYMTDGNAVIATAVDALSVQASYPTGTNVAPGVIVAIGYPVDGPYDPLRRSCDLGPPPGQAYPPFHAGGPPVRTGGAEAFLSFIETELKPWVESRLPIDRERQALFGHSFGGLFALYALFTRPRAFRRWIAASPAIYWEDTLIGRYRRAFAPPEGLDAQVLLSAGEYEGDRLAPFQEAAPDAAERLKQKALIRTEGLAREMAADLAAIPGIRAGFELHPRETHMSVLPVAVNRAVQTAFAVR
ncbi:alpha/beta hydrolase [Labrys wisconsinensis]|uniref:Alpha/beta superfamily hydrolase n=1 Tax=Labrys wisconsinensis TaxID=425677 RepID=A0ABU0J2N0_9HYPH|nr:alpha/beta hydrolase-fold protein [Labrys wisconsinensis]MDQ0467880.1 putative alpha/beta superfamily hydrolase [Labrys wisconsinensis]